MSHHNHTESHSNHSPYQLVGEKAPAWSADALVNGQIKKISSEDYKGKWSVLFFYPLDFTFVCPTEITAFSDANDQFKKLGASLIACSVDSAFCHLAWTERPRSQGGLGEINFPILADIDKSIARNFGVLANNAVALRGTFIIDDKGIIQHSTINNLSVGRNVEETLRLVEAYQYTAKHGEVCPANWNSGKDTMKPDPKGSKEWFQKQK